MVKIIPYSGVIAEHILKQHVILGDPLFEQSNSTAKKEQVIDSYSPTCKSENNFFYLLSRHSINAYIADELRINLGNQTFDDVQFKV